jgi:hypothetical protein
VPDHLNAQARAILRHAAIHRLRDDCVELAALKRAAERPLPTLPTDDRQREAVLLVQLVRQRDYFHRALALVEQIIGTDQAA